MVSRRVTTDVDTGELLEDVHIEPGSDFDWLRPLDKRRFVEFTYWYFSSDGQPKTALSASDAQKLGGGTEEDWTKGQLVNRTSS